MDGEIKLQDSTRGLVSLKAYKKHLATEASGEVIEQIRLQLQQNIP